MDRHRLCVSTRGREGDSCENHRLGFPRCERVFCQGADRIRLLSALHEHAFTALPVDIQCANLALRWGESLRGRERAVCLPRELSGISALLIAENDRETPSNPTPASTAMGERRQTHTQRPDPHSPSHDDLRCIARHRCAPSERAIRPSCGPNSQGFSVDLHRGKSGGFVSHYIIEERWVGLICLCGTFVVQHKLKLLYRTVRTHNTPRPNHHSLSLSMSLSLSVHSDDDQHAMTHTHSERTQRQTTHRTISLSFAFIFLVGQAMARWARRAS